MARWLRVLPLLPLCLALARSARADAPTVAITTPSDGSDVLQTIAVTGSLTGTAPVTVTLTVDARPPVDANVANLAYTGSVTFPSGGHHTLKATASNADGSAEVTIGVTVNPAPVFTIDLPQPGFVTGHPTVDYSGSVADTDLDPNSVTLGGQPLTLDATNHFSGTASVAAGSHALHFVAKDLAGNTTTKDVFGTRTTACGDPDVPAFDNSDPNKPHRFVVNRADDIAINGEFDPNSATACDVRPDIQRGDPNAPPPDPNDPNAPPPQFDPPGGNCSLRAALQVANAHPGPDIIRLPGQVVTLTRRGDGDGHGDLDITEDVVIQGANRDASIVDARKLKDRIFDVAPGVTLTLMNATLRGGSTPKKSGESGGCIRVAGGITDPNDPTKVATFRGNLLALLDCKSSADGGAIELQQDPNAVPPEWNVEDPNAVDPANVSKLTCSVIARSSAKRDGGGIHSQGGVLVVRNSTLAQVSAGAAGGAISIRAGELVLKNATISGNKARIGGGLSLAGGADALLVNNTTFAGNKAKQGMSLSTSDEGGGANTLLVGNTILGDKPKGTCDLTGTSPLVSRGGNLDPGETCNLTEATDLDNSNPQLDKLATNIGIPTHALKSNSPAIDHGVRDRCEPLDERDAVRVDGPPVDDPPPNDDVCDSGAFEFASEAPPETPPATK